MNDKNLIPGISLCIIIGLAAYFLSLLEFIPLDGVTLAILLGLTMGNIVKIPSGYKAGIRFSDKKILSWAIALMGFSLDYGNLLSLGYSTLIIILLTVTFTMGTALFLGRIFKIDRDLSLLLGIGNGICGSSAIAAAQGVLETKEENVGVAVGAINLFGTVGIFILPALSMVLRHFTDQYRGILIGTTLQAVGQVAAAGFSLNDFIGETATIVKMGRILLITPVVLLLSLKKSRRSEGTQGQKKVNLPKIPRYIIIFFILSLINSLGFLNPGLVDLMKKISHFFLMFAMAGIGLSITCKELIRGGKSALLIGVMTWFCQIGFSLMLIRLFH
jgi:uncharacterized integral membrane protein (TIGR00698 family)